MLRREKVLVISKVHLICVHSLIALKYEILAWAAGVGHGKDWRSKQASPDGFLFPSSPRRIFSPNQPALSKLLLLTHIDAKNAHHLGHLANRHGPRPGPPVAHGPDPVGPTHACGPHSFLRAVPVGRIRVGRRREGRRAVGDAGEDQGGGQGPQRGGDIARYQSRHRHATIMLLQLPSMLRRGRVTPSRVTGLSVRLLASHNADVKRAACEVICVGAGARGEHDE